MTLENLFTLEKLLYSLLVIAVLMILYYALSKLFFHIVCPASFYYRDRSECAKKTFYNAQGGEASYMKEPFDNVYYLKSDESNPSRADKKLFINFLGNSDCTYNIERNFRTDIQDQWKKHDHIWINYPTSISNMKDMVNHGESVIKHFINTLGYKPENITIIGYSLGGGVATEVMDRFSDTFKMNNQKFNAFYNINSFSKLSNVIKNILSVFRYIFYFEIKKNELDSTKICKPEFPVSNIIVLSNDNDKVIPKKASLNQFINEDKSKKNNIEQKQFLGSEYNHCTHIEELRDFIAKG